MIKNLLSASLICIASFGFAQSGLTNLSFETYTNIPVIGTSPVGFISTGVSSVTTGAQHLNAYARITSNAQPASSLGNGAMMLGSVFGFTTMNMGAPYSIQPNAFVGWYKANIMTNDTAFIVFDLKKLHVSVITPTVVKGLAITTSTTAWTQFSINITYSGGTPDSAFIMCAANKNWAGNNHPVGTAGTVLDVDNFYFVNLANVQSFEDQTILLGAYPNPASENFNIISKSANAVKVEVYDLSGRLIENRSFTNDAVSINVNNYTAGLYVYKVLDTDNRTLKTAKFTVTQ